MEKGDSSEQLLVKIREEVGKQIIEDAPYGKDYIKWRRGEEKRREKFRMEELLKRKETSSSSSNSFSPIPLPSFSFTSISSFTSSSSSFSSSSDLTQVGVMKDRLGIHYDPIKDPRLFPENIARRMEGKRKTKKAKVEG
jgi:hypothetical protein